MDEIQKKELEEKISEVVVYLHSLGVSCEPTFKKKKIILNYEE